MPLALKNNQLFALLFLVCKTFGWPRNATTAANRWAGRHTCWLLALCCACGAQAYEVADDRGRTVTLAAPPQRVVSLLPSLSEIVCELGQCHRLVGVDRYSNFPASLAKLPQLGGGMDPNIEAVVAARPDLVLISASARAADRLEALGLKVLVLEPKTHADVKRVLATVAHGLGLPPAGDTSMLGWRPLLGRSRSAPQVRGFTLKSTVRLMGLGLLLSLAKPSRAWVCGTFWVPTRGRSPKSTPSLWCVPTPT